MGLKVQDRETPTGQLRFRNFSVNTDAIREEDLDGITHLIIPAIALVEGVVHGSNSDSPELALAAEFAKPAESWNGRPITIDHPEINGLKVSASNPELRKDWVLGTIFNASLEDDIKLSVEMWINTEKVDEIGGEAKEAVDRIVAGEQVEVSTGYFSTNIEQPGIFDSKSYVEIQRDIKPDHLAILKADQVGACSWEDGCGAPRTNSDECGCIHSEPVPYAHLNHLVDAFGTGIVNNRISDQDRRTAISIALQAAEENEPLLILAVFDDTVVYENFFSGEMFERNYKITNSGKVTLSEDVKQVRPVTEFVSVSANSGGNTMTREEQVGVLIDNGSFTEDDRDWLVGLSDDQFDKIHALGGNGDGDGDAGDAGDAGGGDGGGEGSGEASEGAGDAGSGAAGGTPSPDGNSAPVTAQEYLAAAPEGIRESLQDGLRLHNQKKANLIGVLKGHNRNKFTPAQLEAKSVEELENIVSLIGGDTDYTLNAGGTPTTHQEGDDNFAPVAPRPIVKQEAA